MGGGDFWKIYITIYLIEQVAAITKSSPETPHEEEFQRKYGSGIDTLLEGIKNPEDWGTPCKAWSYLPQLQARLNSRVNKKSALKLAEISPSLYSMRNTEIMMPGDLGGKEHSVQIARFEGTMTVLPTKTKPKKFRYIHFHYIENLALPWLLKVTPIVNPHLNDFTGKLKVDPLNLETNQEHSRGSPEFPHLNLRQIGAGVPDLCRTNKQTDKQR